MPRRAKRRAVFLDRDGVLTVPEFRNGRSYAPRRLEDFRLYKDAVESVARLKAAGYTVIVVTNQPDVGAGLMSRDTLREMNRRLAAATRVDAIEVCTSPREAPCRRRKPAPGMLIDAALAGQIDLPASWMVGDRAGDVAAGRAAGCGAIFVDRGYDAETPPTEQDATVASLFEAVDWILTAPVADILPLRADAQPQGDASNVLSAFPLDQAFRRRRGPLEHPRDAQGSVHPRLHHQSDADAQGRDPRL